MKNSIYLKKRVFTASVIVACYNSSFHKIKYTLDSLINQKGIVFEIIIVDDGSVDNYFSEIESYMKEKQFYSYHLVFHKYNEGTVKNIYDGLLKCNGDFIKLISPGDSLIGSFALANWIKALVLSGKSWSFCDVVHYKKTSDGEIQLLTNKCNPQLVSSYLKGNDIDCQWNYLVLDDIALGAAVLCCRTLMLKYFCYIVNRVVYAEDNIYRLMTYNGNIGYYYPHSVLLYEYGEGVSTCNNKKWNERLQKDWETTNEILINEFEVIDKQQEKIVHYLKRKKRSDVLGKVMMFFDKGRFLFKLKNNYFPRMTKKYSRNS